MISKTVFIHTFKQLSKDLYKDINYHTNKLLKSLPKSIVSMDQTHSININKVEKVSKNLVFTNTDALITTDKSALLVIKTADCIPLVITNRSGDFIISAHVGWRNLFKNFEQKLIKQALKHEDDKSNILIYLGPSIKKCCYSFKDKPIQASKKSWKPFIEKSNNLWFIDLQGRLVSSLESLGVSRENISVSPDCTYHNKNFFSHKRNIDTGESISGTMLTIVQLLT